jgi:hypothetical protein
MALRPATAVEKMLPIRGHTASGLKQDLTVRVFAPADGPESCWGCIDIGGQSFQFSSRSEAVAMLDEYLRRAFDRASGLELAQVT